MKTTDLINNLTNEEITFTTNIENALWLLADGSMLDGEFDMGIRGLDHRIIFVGLPQVDLYSGSQPTIDIWNWLHHRLSVVRLIPETMIALINEGQTVTDIQMEMLQMSNYTIEVY